MKKKIKDLTIDEMREICMHHIQDGVIYCIYCENSKCPLWFAHSCLIGFIEKMHYIESEVEINESNND